MSLLDEIKSCQLCEQNQLIPKANPVLQWRDKPRLAVFGQAPGNLADQTGRPFTDPSGVRLRDWMGVDEETFYGAEEFAIIPMAFCFPGYDGTGKTGKGGDRPPPKLCAETWRAQIMAEISGDLELILLIGSYAQDWYLGDQKEKTLTATVAKWQSFVSDADQKGGPVYLPMPHPSWRNNGWIKKNLWFETDLLPWLKARIQEILQP